MVELVTREPRAGRVGSSGLVAAVLAVLGAGAGCRPASTTSLTSEVLGTATSFTVLGGSTVTSTGATTVIGDLGVSPGLAVVGFPPGVVTGGVIHAGDAAALQAQADVTNAYDTLAGLACNVDLTDQDLGGLTLTPGVYCFSSSAQLTGQLTLDGLGDPDALFVFQIGSSLTTASNAAVLPINGAQGCNAYFQVGSSATLGTTTTFVGNIVALTSITLTTGAQVSGRALARNGAVTMDSNHLEPGTCAGVSVDAGIIVDAGTAIDGAVPPPIDAAPPPIDAPAPPPACGLSLGCGPAESCQAGVCVCDGVTCGSTCVDLYSDHDNCGACGQACSGYDACVAGHCLPL